MQIREAQMADFLEEIGHGFWHPNVTFYDQ